MQMDRCKKKMRTIKKPLFEPMRLKSMQFSIQNDKLGLQYVVWQTQKIMYQVPTKSLDYSHCLTSR